jgi:predicted ATPase
MKEEHYVAENPKLNGSRLLVVLAGCSGGGKSSLLKELDRRGFQTFPEPGRQIVKEQLSFGGDALPWDNSQKFIEQCISRSLFFYNTADPMGKPAIFDRSLIDSATAYVRMGLPEPRYFRKMLQRYRYFRRVFMAPPWKELFHTDNERRHTYQEAVLEYEALISAYRANGYSVILVPRGTVAERADFVETQLGV